MSTSNERPSDLPDFLHPPLNEVVLGVQFSPPQGYNSIYAGEVWNLFRSDYPTVEEQPPLPPTFETFGLPSVRKPSIEFVNGSMPRRYWFLTHDKTELIQFQDDRLLHNWRKTADKDNNYPRYEAMVARFEIEFNRLHEYVRSTFKKNLAINQCEISYINHIYFDGDFSNPPWFRLLDFNGPCPEEMAALFREVVSDQDGNPQARLTYEIKTGYALGGRQVIVFDLTYRGKPKSSEISDALALIEEGRSVIVKKFTMLTTDVAHATWGRTQ